MYCTTTQKCVKDIGQSMQPPNNINIISLFHYFVYLKTVHSKKNEISVIIYSPSRCSKPVWVSLFC